MFAVLAWLMLTGCETTGETVAVTAAGASAGLYGANLLATRSKLDVTVEHFDSRKFDQKLFEQEKIAIAEHQAQRVDVVRYPSEAGITEVVEKVSSQIPKLAVANQKLDATIGSFRTFLNHLPKPNEDGNAAGEKAPAKPTSERPSPKKRSPEKPEPQPAPGHSGAHRGSDREAAAYLELCINGLQKWRDANNTTLSLAKDLAKKFDELKPGGLSDEEQKALAAMIDDLRTSIIKRDVSLDVPAYLAALKGQLRASVLELEMTAPKGVQARLQKVLEQFETIFPPDDPTRSDEDRITAVLVPYLNEVFPLLTDVATENKGFQVLSGVLTGVGIIANAQEASRLVTERHASRPDFIAAMVRRWSVMEFSAEVGHEVYEATFARFGIDFNIGSIREELVQALLTSPAINEIVNPDNERYWHQFSYARSQGQTGNHDVIVYMETLGLPVLKSSSFDPTKFQVASGLLYRKAFGAVVDVVGAPIAKVDSKPSASGAAAVSNNLNEAKAARIKAEASAKERQGAMVAAIKTILDGAKAANAIGAEPAGPDRDKTRDAAKKALQDAAAALRAAPKSDDPKKPEAEGS